MKGSKNSSLNSQRKSNRDNYSVVKCLVQSCRRSSASSNLAQTGKTAKEYLILQSKASMSEILPWIWVRARLDLPAQRCSDWGCTEGQMARSVGSYRGFLYCSLSLGLNKNWNKQWVPSFTLSAHLWTKKGNIHSLWYHHYWIQHAIKMSSCLLAFRTVSVLYVALNESLIGNAWFKYRRKWQEIRYKMYYSMLVAPLPFLVIIAEEGPKVWGVSLLG